MPSVLFLYSWIGSAAGHPGGPAGGLGHHPLPRLVPQHDVARVGDLGRRVLRVRVVDVEPGAVGQDDVGHPGVLVEVVVVQRLRRREVEAAGVAQRRLLLEVPAGTARRRRLGHRPGVDHLAGQGRRVGRRLPRHRDAVLHLGAHDPPHAHGPTLGRSVRRAGTGWSGGERRPSLGIVLGVDGPVVQSGDPHASPRPCSTTCGALLAARRAGRAEHGPVHGLRRSSSVARARRWPRACRPGARAARDLRRRAGSELTAARRPGECAPTSLLQVADVGRDRARARSSHGYGDAMFVRPHEGVMATCRGPHRRAERGLPGSGTQRLRRRAPRGSMTAHGPRVRLARTSGVADRPRAARRGAADPSVIATRRRVGAVRDGAGRAGRAPGLLAEDGALPRAWHHGRRLAARTPPWPTTCTALGYEVTSRSTSARSLPAGRPAPTGAIVRTG